MTNGKNDQVTRLSFRFYVKLSSLASELFCTILVYLPFLLRKRKRNLPFAVFRNAVQRRHQEILSLNHSIKQLSSDTLPSFCLLFIIIGYENFSPDVELSKCWSHTFRQSFNGKLRRAVDLHERDSNNSKMAAVINDDSTLPRFHAWKHSLDQSQGTEKVHIKQFLWHINRNTLQGGNNPNTSVIDCG